jgi:hypothetical protein
VNIVLRLSDEIDLALKSHGGCPLRVSGSSGMTEYVILTLDQFEIYSRIFDQGPLTHEEQRAALRHIGTRAGWLDPEMDAYDNYDERRRMNS